jgi:hypothetical protein
MMSIFQIVLCNTIFRVSSLFLMLPAVSLVLHYFDYCNFTLFLQQENESFHCLPYCAPLVLGQLLRFGEIV